MTNAGQRLLMIDDEPTMCRFVKAVAEQVGLAVTTTEDPDEFRAANERERPTIIVLDLQMPKADGVELLRYLASVKTRASILLASGMDMKTVASAENLGRSKKLNMCGTLRKPMRLASLKTLLQRAIKSQRQISADDIRQAMARGDLDVEYQPIASRNASGGWTIDGAEALVRWRHKEFGRIMPDEFIGLAEESDLIRPLTDYVLRESIEQQARWRNAGCNMQVSVNLSPLSLVHVDFPEYLEKVFSEYGAASSDFLLEITEGAAQSDVELAIDILTRLRLKGFGLSLDDFGTGYASLKQLFLLPFSGLKLDRSFVSRMHENDEAAKMVKVMINLAHELGITSCAEGVESTAILRKLEQFGCDKVQGYLISKAVTGDEFQDVCLNWNAETTSRQSAH